jgi:inosine/xanthosine triphosphatase
MKVIVASTNPVKIEVARQAFLQVFPHEDPKIIGVSSDSGVPDQPFDDQVLRGAQNRLKNIVETHPQADYWISQEDGLYHEGGRLFNRAWILVRDRDGAICKSSTASFYTPTKITEYVMSGDELGTASDKFFHTLNSKQKGGAIAMLTGGFMDRTAYYLDSAIIALCQIVHKDWYV